MIKRLIFITLTALIFNISWAQEGSYSTSGLEQYRKGVELFDKEKYASSKSVFEDFIEHNSNDHQKLLVDANYYKALCAVHLFNNDAEFLLSNFIVSFPESPRVKELYFVMGNFQYRKKKYSKAIKWYKIVDEFELSEEEGIEYNFKLAYSYFMKGKAKISPEKPTNKYIDLASERFLKIKDGDNKYAIPAKYFYAHIAFGNKKYETALRDFKALEEDDLFGSIVPYYIIQIYYFQNKNNEVVAYGPRLLDSLSTRRIPEISRILGEAYYKTERFAQAIPYLKKYQEGGPSFTRSDVYQLAYAYYRTKDYKLAAQNFEDISNRKDSLSQNAYYHLADCYLQSGNKEKAMLAFQEASSLDVLPEVKEDAMYNYVKLSFELSYSPFNDAITAIQDYLEAYPNSKHHDEAYGYLSQVFLSTKNYQLAIQTIEKIENKTPALVESYQKVTYYRALEFYVDRRFNEAIDMFDKSIDNSRYNLKTRALAKYWRAESFYKIKKWEKSYTDFNDFVLTSGAFGTEEYKDAHYNMGYALFKLHDYTKAIVWFRKFTEFSRTQKLTKVADAFNRVGDCYFISQNYHFAVDYYEKSIELKRRNVDYAIFQKAFSLGLLKKYDEEIDQLQLLIQSFSESAYLDDAFFEMANAYKYLNANDAAIERYNMIINNFPNSEYRPLAYLQSGMLENNSNKTETALHKFKSLISDYPKSDEAQKALIIMKNIYIDINNVDEYIDFANNNSVETEVSKIEADSLTYITAETLYMSGDCAASVKGFKKYIDKFPTGRYLLNANYFKSDCEFNTKDYESALSSYDYIIEQSANDYTEDALLKAAFITFNDSNYTRAQEIYSKLVKNSSNNTSLLTAKIGLMRTNYQLKNYPQAIKSAMGVLTLSEESKSLIREVHYTIGKSFIATGDIEGAYAEFSIISEEAKSKEGAEANYQIIKIDYDKQNFEQAIKQINSFKESGSPHQFWVAKSFMIWSNIFRSKEDYFMAKAILESIIKNYNNSTDGIVKLAEEKLYIIEDIEVEEEAMKEAIEIEINLNDNENHDKLFMDEEQESEELIIPDLEDSEKPELEKSEAPDDGKPIEEKEKPKDEPTGSENQEKTTIETKEVSDEK